MKWILFVTIVLLAGCQSTRSKVIVTYEAGGKMPEIRAEILMD